MIPMICMEYHRTTSIIKYLDFTPKQLETCLVHLAKGIPCQMPSWSCGTAAVAAAALVPVSSGLQATVQASTGRSRGKNVLVATKPRDVALT